MSEFLSHVMALSATELTAACDEHTAAYPHGNWRAANDRIGNARHVADAALRAAGLWPVTEPYLGNEAVLALLTGN